MDARTAHALGFALGTWAQAAPTKGVPTETAEVVSGAEVVIGMDTRESGPWLAEQVAGGLARAGVKARFAGIITTPGVAYLTRTGPFVAGVMISASHNPYQDNGLKAISHSGYKLPDEVELHLESLMTEWLASGQPAQPLKLTVDASLDNLYTDYLASTVSAKFPLKIVVDCANGAATEVAPRLFKRVGACVDWIGAAPNGRNINLDCGSLHLEKLQQRMASLPGGPAATIGAAFDGDADRCLFVTAGGELVNGDGVLLLAARQMKEQGCLKNDLVVATVMSNLGLENALSRVGIRMTRTPVGDKYVLEEMVRSGANLGGEQSGHVIFSDEQSTGDGLLTALRVALIVAQSGRPLADLVAGMAVYPQEIRNLRVREKPPLDTLPDVMAAIGQSERELGDTGRVIVRYSGTENLVRIMVEAAEDATVRHHVDVIAAALTGVLGRS